MRYFPWKISPLLLRITLMRSDLNIPHKANRILNLVLLAFMLIFLRTWHLGFVQGDYHKQQARKPQRRSLIEKVERATIRDRFNIPLSQNKIDYAIAVRYADIRRIPAYQWIKEPGKAKIKKPLRSVYISSLANLLGEELSMDPKEIEDTIHAKASLFPHTPFVIKESLQEKQYYKIRALQKDWAGIEAQRNSKRVYPQGKTACDVVGYMGAINSSEYMQIAEEIKELELYLQKRENGELIFLPKGHEDPLTVRKRLSLLKEKAYTINDSIGKTGIESSYDELLRGVHGRKNVEVDPKGNIIRELPSSKKGVSGQRVFLSISSELQEFAESLLAKNESIRDLKDSSGESIPGTPWIKGGAIVVLEPKTGEVLALASYPRIDPNDFVQSKNPFLKTERQKSVRNWIESEEHIGEIWEGKTPLKKEIFEESSGWSEESKQLTWDYFLSSIIPKESSIWKSFHKINTIKTAHALQTHFDKLTQKLDFKDPAAIIEVLYPQKPHISCRKAISSDLLSFLQTKLSNEYEELQPSIKQIDSLLSDCAYNDDKLLVLDLVRTLMFHEAWAPPLLEKMGHFSLSDLFLLMQSFNQVKTAVKKQAKQIHHKYNFEDWREKNFKAFLKQKRKEEKEKKTYTKPYTEYLDKVEKSLFDTFWKTYKYSFLDTAIFGKERISLSNHSNLPSLLVSFTKSAPASLAPHLSILSKTLSSLSPIESASFFKAIRSFEDLDRPLYGKYRLLRNTKGIQLEKHLAGAFYPLSGFGYGRSQAFRQSTPQGSLFKLVIAYEALKEQYEYLKENRLSLDGLNPLTLIDQLQGSSQAGHYSSKQILGFTLSGEPIRRLYKGGVMPRSSHAGIGKVDIIQAMEQSSNIYFSILAAEHIADPSLLEKTARDFNFGSKTGLDLQGEIAGSMPSDLSDNKTGLYSFAIGQHSLVGTPLQAAVMLSTIGNKGKVLSPRIVQLTAGKNRNEDPFAFPSNESYPFEDPLSLVGIHFPLFTESLLSSYTPCVQKSEAEVKRSLFMPKEVRRMLIDGMDKVVTGSRGSARAARIRSLQGNPKALRNYNSFKGQMVGKTGTAEILYKQWLDAASEAKIHNHVWFGALIFPENGSFEDDAELAIAVYLRFSKTGGKEAAPITTQLAEKWREIKKKHGGSSYIVR
jgi:cell division protein FtsI/penicillin-binding protein 2